MILDEAAPDMKQWLWPPTDGDRYRRLENILFKGLTRSGSKILGFAGFDQNTINFDEENDHSTQDKFTLLKIPPDDDTAALAALMEGLTISDKFRLERNLLSDYKNHSFVCAGSPITNEVSRMVLFGGKKLTAPSFELHVRDRIFSIGFTFDPKPITPKNKHALHRILAGRKINEPNHSIVASNKTTRYKSDLTRGKEGEPKTGYILFSKLPHPFLIGTKVAIWAGNTGPATEAVRLVINSMSDADLAALEKLAQHDYFQILWRVDDIYFDKQSARHVAGRVSLVKDDGMYVVNERQVS
jgi:hypothetical protein